MTGEASPTFTFIDRKNAEHYSIEYTYIDKQRNLLKSKKTPEGLETIYNYLPGTNLCVATLQNYDGQIQERKFYRYDESGQVILEIEDDGFSEEESDLTGVSYRKVKSIERVKSEGPFFGKPQKEIEYTVDANFQPIPLKQTEYSYTQKDQGYEVEQKIYNSQNNFCYAITKKYDERKRLIHESNPLEHITHYKYDHNNNKTHERIFGSGKELIYDYDYADRLIRKTEKHKSGRNFHHQLSL